MDSSLFFALPLPLSQPMLLTRLAALATLQVDPQGQVVDRKMNLSKTAPHTRLSPAYLFRQNIDPNNLEKGLSGLKFYQQCRQSLTPQGPNDILITFAMRHMTVLNGIALQNLESFNILRPFNYALDLKTAIATCHYFGDLSMPFIRNLKQAAARFKFSGNISNHLERLDALRHIYNTLMKYEPKIMSFLLRSKAQLSSSIVTSPTPYFVHIDDKGRLCLLKRLTTSPDGVYLKALCAHAGSIDLIVLNLEMMPLVAPLGILTQDRQKRLKFDVQEYIQRLDQVDLKDFITESIKPEHTSQRQHEYLQQDPSEHDLDYQTADISVIQWQEKERSFYERFLYQIESAEELNIFTRKAFTPLSAEELKAMPNFSQEVQKLMVFYQFENFPDQRTPELEAQYTLFVTEQNRIRESVIAQECSMLKDNIADYTQGEIEILTKIFEYFAS